MPKTPRKPRHRALVAPKHFRAARELEILAPEVLRVALETSGDQRMVQMRYALDESRYTDHTLASLCARFNVGIKEVAQLVKDHQIAHGLIMSMVHAPEVLENTAIAAKGRKVLCPTCKGKGAITDEAGEYLTCRTCSGEAWVLELHDPAATGKFLEASGLTGKQGGGTFVGVNINQYSSGAGSFEDLMRSAEKKPEVKVIEAVRE